MIPLVALLLGATQFAAQESYVLNLSAEVNERPEILEKSIVKDPLELIMQEEVDAAYFAATELADDATFDCFQAPTNAPIKVPSETCVWWVMRIEVSNLYPTPLESVFVTDHFAAELNGSALGELPVHVELLGHSQGESGLDGFGTQVRIRWCVTGNLDASGECEKKGDPALDRLPPGASASLDVLVFTKLNPAGQQEYTSPGMYELNSGARLEAFRVAETVFQDKKGSDPVITEDLDRFTEETDPILIEAYDVAPQISEVQDAPATITPTPTAALAPTVPPTAVLTPTPTATAALSPTVPATAVLTPTQTATATLTPTDTPTPLATPTPSGCIAGDTGFLSPTAQAADTGGDGDGFELNPTGAFADAGGFATNQDGSRDRHQYFDYSIVLPNACVLAGIEVRLDWWLSSTSRQNSLLVELSWNGGQTWTAPQEDTQETTSEHTAVLGGPSDTWGRSWTRDELSNANFRVRITSRCSGSGCNERDFFLDWAPLKVYVAAPTPTPTPSATPTSTATPTTTATPAATATPTTTPTPPPTATSTPTPTATPSPTPVPAPKPTASSTPTPEVSP